MPTNVENELEILRGVDAIAQAIGEKPRRVYTLLQAKILPADKELGIWTTTKERLRQHYSGDHDYT
jgi:hypothetical protein